MARPSSFQLVLGQLGAEHRQLDQPVQCGTALLAESLDQTLTSLRRHPVEQDDEIFRMNFRVHGSGSPVLSCRRSAHFDLFVRSGKSIQRSGGDSSIRGV